MKFIGKLTQSPVLFNLVSWGATAAIVAGLLIFALGRMADRQPSPIPLPPEAETNGGAGGPVSVDLPALQPADPLPAITRNVSLETSLQDQQRYDVAEYIVGRGDSVFGIAAQFGLQPETIFWANYDLFKGSPDSLQVGMVVKIPPVDGVYYEWQEGDTIESVADKLGVDPEAIIFWPGNRLDLTNLTIEPGTFVMVPGGELNDQPLFIQTYTVSGSGGSSACGGGYASRGYFTWPTANHYLSGYNFGDSGHRGIDIAAPEGTPIYAADNGVVSMASYGAWNYGYGNVVQIDHGNGFVTLYAHLSVVSVSQCQSVAAGTVIGASGNTGNSQGAHLHFEIRYNGSAVNPWNYLPPP